MFRPFVGHPQGVYINLMFVDPCTIVQFTKKNPTRCNSVSEFYYSIFIWSSTCFGWHTAHHQEPKTHWQPLVFHTWKVVGRVSPETCWASFKIWNNKILIHCCILLDFSLWIILWWTDPRTSSQTSQFLKWRKYKTKENQTFILILTLKSPN